MPTRTPEKAPSADDILRLERLVRSNPRVVSFPGPLCGLDGTGTHEVELEAPSPDVAREAARECADALASGSRLRVRSTLAALSLASHPLLSDAKDALAGYLARDFAAPNVPLVRAGFGAVMAIVNVTPDSFSDGGRRLDAKAAVADALAMAARGAAVIDVGGESTRPGATPVTEKDELVRVMPVIDALAAAKLPAAISIDTTKAAVAREALAAGASIVNDVSALASDPAMAETIANAGATVILMHMRGTPRDMQASPRYEGDVVAAVTRSLRDALLRAARAGIALNRAWIDPGFGFGKTRAHNYALLRRLHELRSLGRAIVAGTSRKSMLAAPEGDAPPDRLLATAASTAAAVLSGAALVRVHDVEEMTAVARVAREIRGDPAHESLDAPPPPL